MGGDERRGPQRQPGRALHLLAQLAGHGVGDVDLAALEHGQPGGGVGDPLEHQALHARRLAPVPVEGLEHQLHAGRDGDEAVGPGADRRLLEAVLADLLDVLARNDPRRPGGRGRVERHEVRPRLLEPEADAPGIDRLDRGHPLLQRLRGDAPVALERELHVVGGDGLAVVELRPLPQHELVDEPVRRRGPGLGQAGRHVLARQRLHEGIVQGVQEQEGRDQARRLGRLVERGRRVEVQRPRHLPRGLGRARFRASHRHESEDAYQSLSHAGLPLRESLLEIVRTDHVDQAPGAAAETFVNREESAAEDASKRDVLGIVRPRPSEIVGNAPCLSVELLRRPTSDGCCEQCGEGPRREFVRDLTSPPQLVDDRRRLRPEQGWGDEIIVLEESDTLRGKTRLNERARVDDEQGQRPSLERRTATTTSGIGSPVDVFRQAAGTDRLPAGMSTRRSASSMRCWVPTRRERRRPDRIQRRMVSGSRRVLRAASGTVSMRVAYYNTRSAPDGSAPSPYPTSST